MSRKNKKVTILILLMLCLLAGAWLLLYESRCDRVQESLDAAGSRAAAETVLSGIDEFSNEAVAPAEKSIEEWMTADHVYSHRGSAGQNEHSFEAYDAAIEAGSHNIEQDIVLSKDGTLYVSHDLTAAAMTGDGRAYADMTDEEIDSLNTYAGGGILKLSEVFERYGDKVRYVIELKSGDDATIEGFKYLVDEYGKADRIIVQSLETSVLDRLEEIYPKMLKLLVVKTDAALQQAMDSENVDIVGARVQFVNQDNCDAAHERGKKFVGWTLDSESEIANAIDVGADAYFTNDTPLALELERKYRPVVISRRASGGSDSDGGSGSDHSTIFFASDYQSQDGFDEPKETLKSLLKSAEADGKNLDGAVICGDYTNDATLHDYQLSPEDSIAEINSVIDEIAPNVSTDKRIFVQGNHDALSDSISTSGLHEFDDYLVYVLNTENDFPWKQGKVSGAHDKVKAAAVEMKTCFDKLIAGGETRPIFIAGHVPLHYTARTSSRHTTGDNLYASLIFDVVNESAESLDIIYMHGHNHSKGWDCYMGGAVAYKGVDDSLIIPVFHDSDLTTDQFEEKKLNFTYMNAGYTGYYMNCAPSEYDGESYKAADETLTATVCEIYPDRIEIIRYDKDGRHVLGSTGAANPYKSGIDEDLIGSEYYSKETQSPAIINRKASENDIEIDEAA